MAELISEQDARLALEKLTKADKARRQKLAEAAGFHNFFAYKGYLLECIAAKIDTTPPETVEEPTPKDEPVAEEPVSFSTPNPATDELTDMVIAFDTTGSMEKYIKAVKKYVTELVPKLLNQNPNLQISIVAFGDYCDMPQHKGSVHNGGQKYDLALPFGKAYQVINLTADANALIKFITGAQGTAGGDADEFYELVLRKVRTETAWRTGANKSLLLIADYNPHDKRWYQSRNMEFIDWEVEVLEYKEVGIKVDTLKILDDQFAWFYDVLSKTTDGLALPFSQSEHTGDLIEMGALARGGAPTRAAFMSMATSAVVTDNLEMKKSYAMYKGFVDDRDGKK